jgi:hypothetical protein
VPGSGVVNVNVRVWFAPTVPPMNTGSLPLGVRYREKLCGVSLSAFSRMMLTCV